ncbi:MAG: hypothetical protein C4320_01540, partial [Armatimonadota bacterium]
WIFLKEVREILRDRRARGAVFIGPMFSVLLTILLFGSLGKILEGAARSPIHYIGAENSILTALQKGGLKPVPVPDLAAADRLIRAGDAKVVLRFTGNPDQDLRAGRPVRIEARYDPDEQRAGILLSGVRAAMEGVNRAAVRVLLTEKGMNPERATPLKLDPVEIRSSKGGAGAILVSIIPYLVVLWAFYGGFGMASDIVAGEKERQTLETLLTTPVGRRQVALGKLLALTTMCAIASLAAVLTLAILAALRLPI